MLCELWIEEEEEEENMGRKEEEKEVVAVGVPVYERNGIPPNAIIGDPKGIPIQQTIYRDTPAPFNCPHCANTSLTTIRLVLFFFKTRYPTQWSNEFVLRYNISYFNLDFDLFYFTFNTADQRLV